MGYKNLNFPPRTHFLVTGGAGFIGSNLCEALLEMGHIVRCYDNLSTGKVENVEIFTKNADYDFMLGDIRDPKGCARACKGVDYVLHQAAWGSVPRSVEEPILYDDINVHGTLNMMQAAREAGVKSFVYASSAAVYGDDAAETKKEENVGKLMSPYAVTKRTNEEYAALYNSIYGLNTVGMRYFNVFGKRQDPEGAYASVLPKFVKMLIAGEAPTIDGDGEQTRDFVYIENVIEANLRAALFGEKAGGQVFNVAFGERVSLIECYRHLCKILGKDIAPHFGPERVGDIKHSCADVSKIKKMLEYSPDYSFLGGLDDTIEWYKNNL